MTFSPWRRRIQSRSLNHSKSPAHSFQPPMRVPRREKENRYLRAYGDLVRVGFILSADESFHVPRVIGIPCSPWDPETCWVQK